MVVSRLRGRSASGARQFFTKSFPGDDATVLARSSCEKPASPPSSRRRVDACGTAATIQHRGVWLWISTQVPVWSWRPPVRPRTTPF